MAYEPEVITRTEVRDPATYDLVIRRAHVFDGHKAHAGLHDVAINGGEIAAVSAEPLRGRKEVDAAEGWVMPGLIDTHIHFYDVLAVSDPESMQTFEEKELPGRLDLFLQHGITTIKSVGDPTGGILETRAKIAAGTLRGPRLLATGCGITGRNGHPAATVFGGNPWARARYTGEIDSVQQMRDLVHYLADRKVDAIKLLSEGACACPGSPKYVWQNAAFPVAVELVRLPLDFLRAGIETGHERGLRVTVHTTQQVAAREAIEAGADGLEHGVTVEPITDHSLIDLMLERDITYTPTLWIDDAPSGHSRQRQEGRRCRREHRPGHRHLLWPGPVRGEHVGRGRTDGRSGDDARPVACRRHQRRGAAVRPPRSRHGGARKARRPDRADRRSHPGHQQPSRTQHDDPERRDRRRQALAVSLFPSLLSKQD